MFKNVFFIVTQLWFEAEDDAEETKRDARWCSTKSKIIFC